MKRQEQKAVLLQAIEAKGFSPLSVTLEQFSEILFEQYRDIRLEGCDVSKEEDMLFLEVGYSYDRTEFVIVLGRQSILATELEGFRMGHLTGTFVYNLEMLEPSFPSDETSSVYTWCKNPSELEHFVSEIHVKQVYAQLKNAQPLRVEIQYANN